jgi:hypothetical protein
MKKQIYLILLLSMSNFIQAQNVGIGTTTPTEKLEIKNPLRSTLKISSNSTVDTTELLLSNKTVNGFGTFYTDFSIKSVKENGLFFSSQSDISTNNSINSLVIRPGGNVGIGNASPAYKLDVNGDINTTGLLRLNGSTGATGQVLTSNGTSDPSWAPAGLTHYVGELFGGGIIVGVWKIGGVEHGLIASLTNLSLATPWSNIGAGATGALNFMDGQANTTAIIAQAGHTNSAAKMCNDYSSAGFTDWYLPAAWELQQCFNAAFVVNTIVGSANSIQFYESYWSSNEENNPPAFFTAYVKGYSNTNILVLKSEAHAVRAVRKF